MIAYEIKENSFMVDKEVSPVHFFICMDLFLYACACINVKNVKKYFHLVENIVAWIIF